MSTLEARNYVATAADAANLAAQMFEAREATDTVPRLYLRALVATTIHELGATQRQRAAKPVKINDEEQAQELAALDKVIDLLYPPILARYKEKLGAGRSKEVNSETNWARGAHRDVRNWVRAGHSLTTFAAARLTKAMLAVKTKARPPQPARIKSRMERDSQAILSAAKELAALDRDGAIASIQVIMGQLASQLRGLGVEATKDPREAVAEHLPLRVGKNVFFPTDMLHQMERPS
jgi:hypothetical protein